MKTAVRIIKERHSQKYVAQCRTYIRRMELTADGRGYQDPPHHKAQPSQCSVSRSDLLVGHRKYATTQEARLAKLHQTRASNKKMAAKRRKRL